MTNRHRRRDVMNEMKHKGKKIENLNYYFYENRESIYCY